MTRRDFTATDTELQNARELRDAIQRTVTARIQHRGPTSGDARLLNDWARRPRLTPLLLSSGSVYRGGSATELLATLAADALDLLGGDQIDCVKVCAMAECNRLYVDSSRGHNRQWCGMRGCGNRAKVRAFRARQRGIAPAL